MLPLESNSCSMDMLIFILNPHRIPSFLGLTHPLSHKLSRLVPGTEQALNKHWTGG